MHVGARALCSRVLCLGPLDQGTDYLGLQFRVPYVPHVAAFLNRPTTCAAPGGLVFFLARALLIKLFNRPPPTGMEFQGFSFRRGMVQVLDECTYGPGQVHSTCCP